MTKQTPEDTEAHFGRIVREIAGAINTQDFSITSKAWSHASMDLVAEPAFSQWPKRTTSLKEFLGEFVQHFERHPEYFLRVVDTSFRINHHTGYADVFTNLEAHGLPKGVIRPSIGTLHFVCVKGRWIWIKFVCMPGMAVVVGE